ncbi:MAG: TRAP transporter large permease subunit [Ilumatobacter sp.]|nr:TRAP transporter large permease subunit [Ilumatobacter sp.]
MLAILGLETGVFLSMVMFVVFMTMILTGYNVAFSFASTALAFAFIGDLTDTFDPNALNTLPARWFGAVNDQNLLAVPLFVLMGAILERSGLAERLLTAIGMLMGGLRGGVAAAVVIVGTLLAAATGVVAATVIVMGLLSLPAMLALGYDHKLATGVITASGTLAQLLPPSIVLILLAQQLSVGILNLFAGALLPGLILAGLYVAYVLIISYLKPALGPAMPLDQRRLSGNPSLRASLLISAILSGMVGLTMLLAGWQTALVALVGSFVAFFAILSRTRMLAAEVIVAIVPILLLIIGVLTAIFQGVATPSESGAVGVFGALLLTCTNWLFDRILHAQGAEHIEPRWRLGRSELKQAGQSTANIVVLVMTLLFASTFFSAMFFQLGGSDQTSEWLTSIGGGKWGFVIVAMIALFILGINLEFLEITFIVVPIFVPAMIELGFTTDEVVWFAVLMAVNLNMAFISPPVGFSLFYLQSVAPPEVATADIHKGAIPFMCLQGVALVILAAFPQITTFSINFFG